jgi:hypothetical protein
MWRRLLRVVHPDTGGDAALFVWCRSLQEYVVGDAIEPPRREHEPPRRTTTQDSPRVDYADAFAKAEGWSVTSKVSTGVICT